MSCNGPFGYPPQQQPQVIILPPGVFNNAGQQIPDKPRDFYKEMRRHARWQEQEELLKLRRSEKKEEKKPDDKKWIKENVWPIVGALFLLQFFTGPLIVKYYVVNWLSLMDTLKALAH